MSTPTSVSDLTLRSPDALLSALPYLLGFEPVASAVLIWLAGGRILLTQRLDLPASDELLAPWLGAVWGHQAVAQCEEVVIVLVSPEPAAVAVAQPLLDRAADAGVDVRDVLRLDGDRWWSLMCEDAACCPAAGRRIDPATAAAVSAEFALLGRAPLRDRSTVVASLAPDPTLVSAVQAAPDGAPPAGRRRLEAWRDDVIALIEAHLLLPAPAQVPDPEAMSRMLSGLRDVRVRDTVLWDVARRDAAELDGVLDRLAGLLRAAPAGRVAPVATCCAVVAWLSGDGARALMTIERAQADDPAYSLALLVGASVQGGLPPSAWREAMAGLDRAACRHGEARRPARRAR